MNTPCSRRAGFTLIEILTVIAIIGILAAILIPTVSRTRDSARATRCLSNVRQLALAQFTYAGEHRGQFAQGWEMGDAPGVDYKLLWQARLAPYLIGFGVNPQASVHDNRRASESIFVSPNADFDDPLAVADLGAGRGVTSYRLNANMNAWSWWTPPQGPLWSFRMNAPPIPARVLLLGNGRLADVDYAMPDFENWGEWSQIDFPHAGRTRSNWAFADGHVESLSRADLNDPAPSARVQWRWW